MDVDESFTCNLNDLITRLDSPPIVRTARPPKLLQGRYLIGGRLGQGSYGKVKLCVDTVTGSRLAVKIITIRLVRKIAHGLDNVDREAQTMRDLCHENVTRVFADFCAPQAAGYGEGKRYLVMEWAVCSIHDLQTCGGEQPDSCRCLPETQARHYFRQLLSGVEYLHSVRIVHKDLKPGNLLLTPEHVVKIADFGVCQRLAPDSATGDTITGSQATPAIQPPEVANGSRQFSGFMLDMYCCGVTLYFMVCGRVPYSGKNVLLIFESIAAGNYTVPDWVGEPCRRLIGGLMSRDSADRPSVAEARRYDWLAVASPSLPGSQSGADWVRLEDHFQMESADAAAARLMAEFNGGGGDGSTDLPAAEADTATTAPPGPCGVEPTPSSCGKPPLAGAPTGREEPGGRRTAGRRKLRGRCCLS